MAYPFSLGQVCLAAAQFLLRPLAFSDVYDDGREKRRESVRLCKSCQRYQHAYGYPGGAVSNARSDDAGAMSSLEPATLLLAAVGWTLEQPVIPSRHKADAIEIIR
jgi:hypothetical protein